MHFITFSRKYAAGGTEVARKVAEKLGYRFYDTDAQYQAMRGSLERGLPDAAEHFRTHVPAVVARRLVERQMVGTR